MISTVFYMILLSSSVAGQKLISVFGLTISAGSIIFPMTYMFIACITEVYGLKQARIVIFTGAICNIFVALYLYFVIAIPHAPFWQNQLTFAKTTTITAKILLNSTLAYIVSEYANAKIISKLKILLKGRWLLARAISSTSIAAIIDSTFMLPIIILNSPEKIFQIYLSLIFFKISYEICLLPLF